MNNISDTNAPDQQSPLAPKALICSGFHRSATSSFSHYLSNAGLKMGNNLMLGSISNLKGHFEDWDMVELHDKQLKKSNTTWHFHDECCLQSDDVDFQTYVNARFMDSVQWGAKDPRAALFLPEWHRALKEQGCYVFVIRHWSSCVESLLNRHSQQIAYQMAPNPEKILQLRFWSIPTLAAEMWISYNERILNHIEQHRSQTLVITQRALFNGAPILDAIASQLGIKLNVDAEPPFQTSLLRDFAYEHNKQLYSVPFLERMESLWEQLLAQADFHHSDETPQWIQFPTVRPVDNSLINDEKNGEKNDEKDTCSESIAASRIKRMYPTISILNDDPALAIKQLKRLMHFELSQAKVQPLIEQVDRKYSCHQSIQLTMAKLLLKLSIFKEAIRYIEKASAIGPYYPYMKMLLAQCHEGMNNYETALFYYNGAIRENRNSPLFFLYRGNLHFKLGNIESADRDFAVASTKKFDEAIHFTMYGDYLRKSGRFSEARDVAQKLMEMKPSIKTINYLAAVEMQLDFNQGQEAYFARLAPILEKKNFFDWLSRACQVIGQKHSADDFIKRCTYHWQEIRQKYTSSSGN